LDFIALARIFLLADILRKELRHRLQNLFRKREELGGAGVTPDAALADFLAAGRQLGMRNGEFGMQNAGWCG